VTNLKINQHGNLDKVPYRKFGYANFYFLLLVSYTNLVGLDPTTSPSIPLLWEKAVPIEP
jgi:hypothetical protein